MILFNRNDSLISDLLTPTGGSNLTFTHELFLCESPVTAGPVQVHYDAVLLDLCYLQELDVILCV